MCIAGEIPRKSQDPVTIGHEAAGEVVEVGSKVHGFRKGDQVGFLNSYRACWSCKGCSGHFMLCSDSRMRMQGFTGDGFFQEYCAIDPASTVVLPEGMKAQDTAPIFCAGITCMFAKRKFGKLCADDRQRIKRCWPQSCSQDRRSVSSGAVVWDN